MTTNFYFKCFIFFLKKQGIYNNFIVYYNQPQNIQWRNIANYGPDLIDIIEMDYQLIICHSFMWASTKEGFEYWEKICKRWKKLLYNFHLEKITYQHKKNTRR